MNIIKAKICDQYCKYPFIWDEEKEGVCLAESDICKNCPLNYLPEWITDRTPTNNEIEEAGDVGFILCVSGKRDNFTYEHAILMYDNFYEDDKWYIFGVADDSLTIHGWLMPPAWEE